MIGSWWIIWPTKFAKSRASMPDLILIPLADGPMTDNLETSIATDGQKPWAFNSYLSTMKGVRPDVYVAFAKVTAPSGGKLGKAGPVPIDALVHRIVVGRVNAPVTETSTPFFPGFPHQFSFELVDDVLCEPPVPLTEASTLLNAELMGLGMDGPKLRELFSNARSAKIGMFFDGQPRKAEYFKTFESVALPTSPTTEPSAASPSASELVASDALRDAADDFDQAVREAGLVFAGINEGMPRAFLAALVAKRFAILTGLSGSGKTQLARAFGQWLQTDSAIASYLVVPVRADWTTPEPLLGYEDALLPMSSNGKRAWSAPPALEFILQAQQKPSRLFVLILDEMNLAHVERYFADVLSGMESGEPILPNLQRSSGNLYPVDDAPALVPLPANLFLVGTVNVDETTYQFSPKVLDRSFSFEFRVSTEELDAALRNPQPAHPANLVHLSAIALVARDPDWHLHHPSSTQTELQEFLLDLHRKLSTVGLEFGHRSYREALRMAAALDGCGITGNEEIIDWVVMTKVLPRLHGSRRQLEALLHSLLADAIGSEPEKPVHPLIARKVKRMLESLVTNQYAGFAE
jgi:5-methylcytosine-specific restriction protein B